MFIYNRLHKSSSVSEVLDDYFLASLFHRDIIVFRKPTVSSSMGLYFVTMTLPYICTSHVLAGSNLTLFSGNVDACTDRVYQDLFSPTEESLGAKLQTWWATKQLRNIATNMFSLSLQCCQKLLIIGFWAWNYLKWLPIPIRPIHLTGFSWKILGFLVSSTVTVTELSSSPFSAAYTRDRSSLWLKTQRGISWCPNSDTSLWYETSLVPRPTHVFQHLIHAKNRDSRFFACNIEKHGKAWVRG